MLTITHSDSHTCIIYKWFPDKATSLILVLDFLFTHCSGPFTRSDFKDPVLGSKIESRRSDGPISRSRFCCENVGRPFVVCSHDLIFTTEKESSIWRQKDHRDIIQNLLAPFIFQEECRMKIKHALFLPAFQNYGFLSRKVIFNVFTRSDFRNQQK